MKTVNFREWASEEKNDLFGFERARNLARRKKEEVMPIEPIEIETIMKELVVLPLGTKKALWDWHDKVSWGNENRSGSLLIDMSPIGSFKALIRQSIVDSQGDTTWICKNIYDFNEHKEKNPTTISMMLYDELTKADLDTDSCNRDFNKLEQYALKIAGRMKLEHPKIMMFNKLKKMHDNYYLTTFNFCGHGVEAPGARRVEQFHVHLLFDKNKGLIRSWANDVSSPTNQHTWEVQPSEWDEWFAPSQDFKEISNVIVNALMSY